MPDFDSSTEWPPPSRVIPAALGVIPGAGSAGLVWEQTLAQLNGTLLPVPDEPDVGTMASALAADVERLPEPRVLAGASLGAMVALEVARSMKVSALVLIAAGFGIEVSDSLLSWVAADPPDLFPKMARASIHDRDNHGMVDAITQDFALRGQPVVLRHLRALAAYRPQPLDAPPLTIVLWGVHDHSVPLTDHAELAVKCNGALVGIRDAGHMPFFEQPDQTVRWIRQAARWAQV
jgi:pimeloyl-ACP methyl ester carboxylesterase